MSKKKVVNVKILTFAQMCAKIAPTFVGPQSASVTELPDNHPNELKFEHARSGTLKFTDTAGDTHTATVVPKAGGYLGTFSASVNQNTDAVNWTFKVKDGAIDHLAVGQTLTQTYTILLKDYAGNTTSTTVTIQIVGTNDAPIITSKAQSGAVAEVADGKPGENAVTHSQSGLITFSDVDKIDTHNATIKPLGNNYLGTLTLGAVNQATDSLGWNFQVNDALLDSLGPKDTLTQKYLVTIDDKHGGTATTIITITIKGADDGVTIKGLDVAGGEVVVDEQNLSDGSAPNASLLTKTGTFTVSAPDGLASIVIGATTIPLNGTQVSVPTPTGNSLLVRYVAGVVTYTYTLLDNEQHAAGLGENILGESFVVTVKDKDGSTATGSLDVKIVDDIPTVSIAGTSNTVAEDGIVNGTWSQTIGADQNGASTVVVIGANTYALGSPIAVTGGTLTVNANGTWSFAAGHNVNNADATPDVVNFAIRVRDGDGDIATDTHTITITDGKGPSISGQPLSLTVDDQNLANGSTPASADFAQGAVSFTAGSDDITSFAFANDVSGLVGGLTWVRVNGTLIEGRDGGTLIVSLTLTPPASIAAGATGSATVTVTLHDNYDSHPGIDADDLVGLGSVGVVATDIDGTTATNTVNLSVSDDVPAARSDSDAVTAAAIQVLSFDDVPLSEGGEQPIPFNYGGFTWTQTGIHNPQPGSTYIPTSGDNLAFFAEARPPEHPDYPAPQGSPIGISGGVFSFLGASFVARNGNMNVTATGYPAGGGAPVTYTFLVLQGVAQFVDFSAIPGFANLTKIEFHGPDYFGFDDFTTRGVAPAATGNVVTAVDGGLGSDTNGTDGVADGIGADGFGSISWTGAVGNTVAGAYGTLTVDANGNYAYAVNSNDASVAALNKNQSLTETFTYTIVDGDGDHSTATLTITVNGADDPVVLSFLNVEGGEIVLDESNLADGSNPNAGLLQQSGVFGIAAGDGVASVTIAGTTIPLDGTTATITTPLGNTLQATYNAATGTVSYTYILLDNDNHLPGGGRNAASEQFAVVVVDTDGTTATGVLNASVIDDVPTASNEASQNVAEGATITGTLDFVAGADGATVTHINGTALVFDPADANYSQPIDLGSGVIKVKADGSYTFTANVATTSPVAPIQATYTVTDGDGDTATANISLQVTDANVPAGGTAAAFVDDDALPGGNPASTIGDLAVPNTDGDNYEANFSGTLGGSVGLDQPGTFSFAALGGTSGTVGTETVNYTWNAANNTLTATGPRGPLFNVQITDPSTGAYTVNLIDNVLHSPGENENDAIVTLAYVIRDADGSTAPGTLTITFDDDAPTANAGPTLTISENDGMVTGINLFTNDAEGADTARVTHVTFGSTTYVVDPALGVTVVTTNGTYKFTASGNWTFDPVPNPSNANQNESFTYRITDADGDTSEAVQNIVITNANTQPTAGTAAGVVDDEGLANGIAGGTGDVTGQATTATGVLPHDFGGDGKAAVDPVSFSSMHGTTGTVGTEAVTYAWNGATNTLTATSARGPVFTVQVDGGAETGAGAYAFTLLKPVLHATGNAENDAVVNLTYTVRDSNGDATNGTLSITIDDDTPVANARIKTINEAASNNSNVMLLLDVSGSMDDPSGLTGLTRLDVLKASVVELLEQYDNMGDVKVRIVTFSSNADAVGAVWMSVAEAKAAVLSLTAGGSTNYDDTLSDAVTAFSSSGSIAGAQNVAYFVSDGEPNQPSGSAGISPTEQAVWENFLSTNKVVSYALGAGTGVTASALEPVAFNGASGQQMPAIVVTDMSQLTATLVGTVNAVTTNGNLLTDATAGGFGADGGYINQISINGQSFNYNPATDQVTTAGGTQQFTFVQATNVLTITTAIGASFVVDLDDGTYSYTGPASINTNLSEIIGYQLIDNDGDTASNTLTVNIVNGDRAPIVRDDKVITNMSGSAIVIPEYALLYNDSDPDGQVIAVTGSAADISSANSVPRASGNFTFNDNNSNGGSFTYTGSTSGPAASDTGSVSVERTSSSTLNGTGLAEILIGGNSGSTINGDAGHDVLIGGTGNDRLVGGTGNDLLHGGAGNDTFVFNTALNAATNVDIIRDFDADAAGGQDRIELSQAIFGGIGGTLSASEFAVTTDGLATTAAQRIIYNSTTGTLTYDADGSGAGAGIHFAVVKLTSGAGTFDAGDFIMS